jgi:site-specific recombinase XerC
VQLFGQRMMARDDMMLAAFLAQQELAAIRMLFDWLVVGQVMQANPASSVRGPRHVVKTGKTQCWMVANGAA